MEILKNIIEYLAIAMSGVFLVYKTNNILMFYQQAHYHFSSFKRIIKHYYFGKLQYFIFGILAFVMFLNLWYIAIIYILYIVFLLVIFFKRKGIIKLKQTARIYRNYITLLLIGTIISSTILLLVDLPELNSSLALIIFFLPFLVFLSSAIIYPIELLISKYYQCKSRKKLAKINPTTIGITGSFGKTTTKNILFEFLKDKYITLKTRKSFNTLNGLSISINEDLTKEVEVFIAEMGASRVGDISDLVNLVPLNYAILTGITSQHLESFKTVQNIINEKVKIIEALDENGIGIVNGDDKFLNSIHFDVKAKLIKFGFSSTNDYYATDIKLNKTEMSFTINYENKKILVKTNLIGRHNVLNILASFALAKELGVSDLELVEKIKTLEAPKNRLKIEKLGTHVIIDDSFNSNNVGFVNALEVLSLYSRPRILITPGIVEGGSLEAEMNYELASEIVKVVDEVVLIETKASMHILEGLKSLGFEKVVVLDKFVDAKKYVFEKYPKGTILIENDVCDIYKI